jgi:hypothetical protein
MGKNGSTCSNSPSKKNAGLGQSSPTRFIIRKTEKLMRTIQNLFQDGALLIRGRDGPFNGFQIIPLKPRHNFSVIDMSATCFNKLFTENKFNMTGFTVKTKTVFYKHNCCTCLRKGLQKEAYEITNSNGSGCCICFAPRFKNKLGVYIYSILFGASPKKWEIITGCPVTFVYNWLALVSQYEDEWKIKYEAK